MATQYYMVRSQGGAAKVPSNVTGRYTLYTYIVIKGMCSCTLTSVETGLWVLLLDIVRLIFYRKVIIPRSAQINPMAVLVYQTGRDDETLRVHPCY